MSAAAVALVGLVVALAPICAARPWIGVLVYTWLSLMNPHRLVGDGVADLPLAKLVALATLVGLLFTRDRYPLPRHRGLAILAALWAVCVASTVLSAQEPARAWAELERFTKVVLMTFVGLALLRGRGAICTWVAVIALSIGSLLVGGLFLNQPYFEPLYQLIAVAILIDDAAEQSPTAPMRRATTSLAADLAGLLQRG